MLFNTLPRASGRKRGSGSYLYKSSASYPENEMARLSLRFCLGKKFKRCVGVLISWRLKLTSSYEGVVSILL